jgi:sRNA-binding protein
MAAAGELAVERQALREEREEFHAERKTIREVMREERKTMDEEHQMISDKRQTIDEEHQAMWERRQAFGEHWMHMSKLTEGQRGGLNVEQFVNLAVLMIVLNMVILLSVCLLYPML